jgi:hypothetical protein
MKNVNKKENESLGKNFQDSSLNPSTNFSINHSSLSSSPSSSSLFSSPSLSSLNCQLSIVNCQLPFSSFPPPPHQSQYYINIFKTFKTFKTFKIIILLLLLLFTTISNGIAVDEEHADPCIKSSIIESGIADPLLESKPYYSKNGGSTLNRYKFSYNSTSKSKRCMLLYSLSSNINGQFNKLTKAGTERILKAEEGLLLAGVDDPASQGYVDNAIDILRSGMTLIMDGLDTRITALETKTGGTSTEKIPVGQVDLTNGGSGDKAEKVYTQAEVDEMFEVKNGTFTAVTSVFTVATAIIKQSGKNVSILLRGTIKGLSTSFKSIGHISGVDFPPSEIGTSCWTGSSYLNLGNAVDSSSCIYIDGDIRVDAQGTVADGTSIYVQINYIAP